MPYPFTVGKLRASELNDAIAFSRPLIARVGSDQALATGTTTLANVTDLVISVAANVSYDVALDWAAVLASGTTEDIKWAFTFPTGATLDFWGPGLITGMTGTAGDMEGIARLSATSGSTVISNGLSTTVTGGRLVGRLVVSSTAGSLQVQAAQNTSGANAVTVKAGSRLRLDRVA